MYVGRVSETLIGWVFLHISWWFRYLCTWKSVCFLLKWCFFVLHPQKQFIELLNITVHVCIKPACSHSRTSIHTYLSLTRISLSNNTLRQHSNTSMTDIFICLRAEVKCYRRRRGGSSSQTKIKWKLDTYTQLVRNWLHVCVKDWEVSYTTQTVMFVLQVSLTSGTETRLNPSVSWGVAAFQIDEWRHSQTAACTTPSSQNVNEMRVRLSLLVTAEEKVDDFLRLPCFYEWTLQMMQLQTEMQ